MLAARFFPESSRIMLGGELVTITPYYHYGLSLLVWFGVMAGAYLLLPPNRPGYPPLWVGLVHVASTSVGVVMTFSPHLFLEYGGMPRRYIDYADGFKTWANVSSFGAYLFIASTAFFIFAVVFCAIWHRRRNRKIQSS